MAEEEKPIRITYADENTKFTIYCRIDDYIETKTGKRSQSALEYMMTYGWAILIIVIVAVLYFC